MSKNKILEIKYILIPVFLLNLTLIVFESIYNFLSVFGILLIGYIYLAIKYKNISFVSILLGVSILNLYAYIFFIHQIYDEYTGYAKMFTMKVYTIEDNLTNNRYVAKDDFGSDFIIKNAAKNYKLGDTIKVYGMMYPIKLKYDNYADFYKNRFLKYNSDMSKLSSLSKFDYTKYLMMKGIVGTVYSKKEYVISTGHMSIFQKCKQKLIDKTKQIYSGYDDKYAALTLGLLVGDKSLLSKSLYDEFIHSGLVHIIVVSGGNIMFLMIFVSILLFFIPFYPRLIIVGGFVLLYAMLVGGDSSVIRATIMGILSLLALFLGKVTDIRRILAIAFILMIFYNPYFMLYDLGFILSFSAIMGILFFNRFSLKKKENKFYNGMIYFYNNYVLLTLGASLFVAPFILIWTKQLNVLSFLASILVVPIVPILMLNSLLVYLLSSLSIGHIFLAINIHMMDYIFYVSHLIGEQFTYFLKL